MKEINIGIISDGSTDFEIFSSLSDILFTSDVKLNKIRLKRHCLRHSIDTYWRSNQNNRNSIFVQTILQTLYGALEDFYYEIGRYSNEDIVLVTSDAERHFKNNDCYFEDWTISFRTLINTAIDKFYNSKVKEGRSHSTIPHFLPIILFPSTDKLVASIRDDIDFHSCLNRPPNELKQLLYGTSNLSELQDNTFTQKATSHFTISKIDKIFSNNVEIRHFIKAIYMQ
jgi:hypothetical protein